MKICASMVNSMYAAQTKLIRKITENEKQKNCEAKQNDKDIRII